MLDHAGTYSIGVKVEDGQGGQATGSLELAVTNVNRAPVLQTIANVIMSEGQTQTVALSATDADGDAIAFTAAGLPPFGALNGANIVLSPQSGDAGNYSISVTASDGSLSDTRSFTFTVTPVNTAPTLSNAEQVDTANQPVPAGATVNQPPALRATIADAQNQNVKLEAEVRLTTAAFTGNPTHTTALSAPGTLTLLLGSLPAGAYHWQLRAVDSLGLPSAWTQFNGGNTAFVVASQPLNGTLTIDNGAPATRTPSSPSP